MRQFFARLISALALLGMLLDTCCLLWLHSFAALHPEYDLIRPYCIDTDDDLILQAAAQETSFSGLAKFTQIENILFRHLRTA